MRQTWESWEGSRRKRNSRSQKVSSIWDRHSQSATSATMITIRSQSTESGTSTVEEWCCVAMEAREHWKKRAAKLENIHKSNTGRCRWGSARGTTSRRGSRISMIRAMLTTSQNLCPSNPQLPKRPNIPSIKVLLAHQDLQIVLRVNSGWTMIDIPIWGRVPRAICPTTPANWSWSRNASKISNLPREIEGC